MGGRGETKVNALFACKKCYPNLFVELCPELPRVALGRVLVILEQRLRSFIGIEAVFSQFVIFVWDVGHFRFLIYDVRAFDFPDCLFCFSKRLASPDYF